MMLGCRAWGSFGTLVPLAMGSSSPPFMSCSLRFSDKHVYNSTIEMSGTHLSVHPFTLLNFLKTKWAKSLGGILETLKGN